MNSTLITVLLMSQKESQAQVHREHKVCGRDAVWLGWETFENEAIHRAQGMERGTLVEFTNIASPASS